MDATQSEKKIMFLFLYIPLLSSPFSVLLAFSILHSLAYNFCLRWLLPPPSSSHIPETPALLRHLAVSHLRVCAILPKHRSSGRFLIHFEDGLVVCGVLGTWKVRIGIATVRADISVERTRVSAGEKKDVRPIIVIDNYDSFTYNLCQYIGELGVDFEVFRNDELTVEEIRRKSPRGILISPGPGMPQDSGISLQTVVELGPSIPLFGVCMGLQCIGEAFGGKIVRAPSGVRHGKSSLVYYDEKLGESLFDGLPNPFSACRYHSLVIEKKTFPRDKLEVTAWTEDGLIMAARHKKYKHIKGVQFHPESIITPDGKMMILNFINFVDKFQA